AVNRVALAKSQIEVAVPIDGDRAGPVERRAFHGRTIRSRLPLAGSSKGLDSSGGKIHLSNAVISDIADKKAPLGIDGNAMRLTQLRPYGRTAVPGKSRAASSSKGGDDARLHIDLTHHVVVALGDIKVTGGIELISCGM